MVSPTCLTFGRAGNRTGALPAHHVPAPLLTVVVDMASSVWRAFLHRTYWRCLLLLRPTVT